VKKEKTGASGRSQMTMVRPFGSFFTVTRFSKDAISWAAARIDRHATRNAMTIIIARRFISTSGDLNTWTDMQGRSLKVRGAMGGCQTGGQAVLWAR
jgi:hypothetical protein